ncbi:hypothetical protein E4U13_006115, partial [Claviceps humidiphila]
ALPARPAVRKIHRHLFFVRSILVSRVLDLWRRRFGSRAPAGGESEDSEDGFSVISEVSGSEDNVGDWGLEDRASARR